jgi:hypothetical protein
MPQHSERRRHYRAPIGPPTQATERDLDEQWFHAELGGKLEALGGAIEDLGAEGPGDYDGEAATLLAVSVLAREAAVCIATRPVWLRS